MKYLFSLALGLLIQIATSAQDVFGDSLKNALKAARDDTFKVNILHHLSRHYLDSSPDQAQQYGLRALELARKLKYPAGRALALNDLGVAQYYKGDLPTALDHYGQSLQVYDSIGDFAGKARILNNFGAVYYSIGDDAKALESYFKSIEATKKLGDKTSLASAYTNIANVYLNKRAATKNALDFSQKALHIGEQIGNNDITATNAVILGEMYLGMNKEDSALHYFNKSLQAYSNTAGITYPLRQIGLVYLKKGDFKNAIQYGRQSYDIASKFDSRLDKTQALITLGDIYLKKGDYPSALHSYEGAASIAMAIPPDKGLYDAYAGLATTYSKLGNFKQAFKYQKLSGNIADSLSSRTLSEKMGSLQEAQVISQRLLQSDILSRNKEAELRRQKEQYVNNVRLYLLYGGLVAILIWAVAATRSNQRKRKTNLILEQQKNEIENSLSALQSTQKQLIQSEKMASLGELTAGIAHEIQNPLNFVNNFSEVNAELVDEMQQQMDKGNYTDARGIAHDIKENELKISYHGKRADSIVKGMLQHAQSTTGQKEPTDINALADEYLGLSYKGLRARDKAFHATLKTDFDQGMSKIYVVPQDIGRVLLNLYNNAFYVVSERKKLHPENYEPTISVSTKKNNGKVEIKVKDNGSGIPEKVLDKIFQPFFTTKPAGQGTGLGLSLSYDIVKAHGGEIKVNTKEGEFTEFVIQLPAST